MKNGWRIKFFEGHIYHTRTGWKNPSGYYIQRKVLFFFWWKVAGPFRHIQQAEKAFKKLQEK